MKQLKPSRKVILESLSFDDISAWKKIKSKKKTNFLKTNDTFWVEGFDGGKTINPTIYENAIGKYKGFMDYEINELDIKHEYEIEFTVQENYKISYNLKSSDSSASGTMSKMNIGSDHNTETLNIIFHNFLMNESKYISDFAFKLPSFQQNYHKENIALYGLDEKLQWKLVGQIVLERVNLENNLEH